MIEGNVIGDLVDSGPLDRLALGVGSGQLGDLRTVLLDCLVTGHARGGRRDGGEVAVAGDGMALRALQLQRSGVQLVTVGDRLLRRGPHDFGLRDLREQDSGEQDDDRSPTGHNGIVSRGLGYTLG